DRTPRRSVRGGECDSIKNAVASDSNEPIPGTVPNHAVERTVHRGMRARPIDSAVSGKSPDDSVRAEPYRDPHLPSVVGNPLPVSVDARVRMVPFAPARAIVRRAIDDATFAHRHNNRCRPPEGQHLVARTPALYAAKSRALIRRPIDMAVHS